MEMTETIDLANSGCDDETIIAGNVTEEGRDECDETASQTKQKRTNYSKGEANEKMKRAVNAYYAREGSILVIAEKYSVSREALRNRLKNKFKLDAQSGCQPLLNREEENHISNAIIALLDKGVVVNHSRIKNLIEKCLANKQSSVTKVSRAFVYRLLRRRPELYQRLKRAMILKSARTKNTSRAKQTKQTKQTNIKYKCRRCGEPGPDSSLWICCSSCDQFFHVNCFRFLQEKSKNQIENQGKWFCNNCN